MTLADLAAFVAQAEKVAERSGTPANQYVVKVITKRGDVKDIDTCSIYHPAVDGMAIRLS